MGCTSGQHSSTASRNPCSVATSPCINNQKSDLSLAFRTNMEQESSGAPLSKIWEVHNTGRGTWSWVRGTEIQGHTWWRPPRGWDGADCNFVLKGNLPFSYSSRKMFKVGRVALCSAQRALAWVSGMMRSSTLVLHRPMSCLTHTCQI